MRLIDTETLEMKEFLDHRACTRGYAILSHRWTNMEVSYEEFATVSMSREQEFLHESPWLLSRIEKIKQKSGYQKIIDFCANARRRDVEWAWIDTCCIDKRSSAELSEAINSMWMWYEYSDECYIYLADVPASDDRDPDRADNAFIASSWWSRCWTLQELLAPRIRLFYSAEWTIIGELKSGFPWLSRISGPEFGSLVSNISRIPVKHLTCHGDYEHVCVAQRMSWAARREATRREDEAYSLLGLFGIQMPLLYGEGSKAFFRLQKKILKHSGDESIFMWKSTDYPSAMLAPNPRAFQDSGNIRHAKNIVRGPHKTTSLGVKFSLGANGSKDLVSVVESDERYRDPASIHGALYTLNCSMVEDEKTEQMRPCQLAVELTNNPSSDSSDQMFTRYYKGSFAHEIMMDYSHIEPDETPESRPATQPLPLLGFSRGLHLGGDTKSKRHLLKL